MTRSATVTPSANRCFSLIRHSSFRSKAEKNNRSEQKIQSELELIINYSFKELPAVAFFTADLADEFLFEFSNLLDKADDSYFKRKGTQRSTSESQSCEPCAMRASLVCTQL